MTTTTATNWETVIGLETHVELATATKLFCGCPNEFGAEPNTNVCPVCLGLPGSLPVLNARAVEFALRVGEALHCDVPEHSIFHRKNYFYPDMPKDYQISQYDEPICIDGWLEVDGERVGIERAHMEEDTGKTLHVGGGGRIHEADHSLVDYNRAGVPLMEIVSRPDLRSAAQARAYVSELRAILETVGVSDVKMEEGSFRIDANVSLRPAGRDELGTKVEVKNMNSLRSLGRALEFEVQRQVEALESGERIVQETRHWDEDAGVTHGMRTKEGSEDYRYFPEPDLVPVAPDERMRSDVRASMPELPAAKRARLVDEWKISEHDARVLLGTPGLTEYISEVLAATQARSGESINRVVNLFSGFLLAYVNALGIEGFQERLPPARLAETVDAIDEGTISVTQAKKEVLEFYLGPLDQSVDLEPATIKVTAQVLVPVVIAKRELAQVSDESELASLIDRILADHPDEVASYRSGDEKARKKIPGFLMGQAMRAAENKANPQLLRRLLEERLG